MIKNLVLSACGPNMYTMLGVLDELHKQKFWNINNIENFYGSSGGTILAVFMLLSDDFNTLKEYMIKRPWHTVWTIDPNTIFNMYQNLGLFNIDDFYKGFEPFFKAKNIDRNITLKEFYDLTKKTIYFYIVELNNFEVIFVNHITDPDMNLIEAMYKSSCVPGIFVPFRANDKCYIDGGLMDYFPVNEALKESNNETILGICNKRSTKCNKITSESNMMDFLATLLLKNMDFVVNNKFKSNKSDQLNNLIFVPGFDSNKLWVEIINYESKRNEMYNLGIVTADQFLTMKQEGTCKTDETKPNDPHSELDNKLVDEADVSQ